MLGNGDTQGGALGGLDLDMPRFLVREEAFALASMRPPPLPSGQWRAAGHAAVARVVALKVPAAVVLVAAGLVSVGLIVGGRRDAPQAPTLVTQPAPLVRATVSDSGAVRLTPATEPLAGSAAAGASAYDSSAEEGGNARLSFAGGLAQRAGLDLGVDEYDAKVWAVEPALGTMLFVSNLPEGATLREGAPAGNGTWVVGASEPAALHGLIEMGFETPVAVAVEQLDASGTVAGTAILTLHRPPMVASVPATAAPIAKASDASDVKAKVKRKRKRFAKAVNGRWTAASEAGERRRKKRIVRDDAYTGGRIARRKTEDAEPAATPVNAENQDEPGVISKFVGWLKGSPSKDDAGEQATSPATLPPSVRDDGAINTFGMFPDQ